MRTFFTLVLTLIGRGESTPASCSIHADCGQNAECDADFSDPQCMCNSGYSSASGTNQDCAQDCPANSCDANADCAMDSASNPACTCKPGFSSSSGDPTTNGDCAAVPQCPSAADCDANADCDYSTGTVVCTCKAGYYSPTADATTGQDCKLNEVCDGTSCDSLATCDSSAGPISCTCNAGHYSPTGDATTGKDCAARTSTAKITMQFTGGSDFKWKNGALYYQDSDASSGVDLTNAQSAVTLISNDFTYVRGATSFAMSGVPTFAQSGATEKVTITAVMQYNWNAADIADSANSLADDLLAQIKTDLNTLIAGQTKSNLIEDDSQAAVVLTDATDYPTWSPFNAWSTCSATCTRTRTKDCPDQTGNPGSQITCVDDPASPASEMESCNTETCHQLPCPSYCWSWSESEKKCSINEDHACLELECQATAINIYFKPELFNIEKPGTGNTPATEAEIFGTGTNVVWDDTNGRYKQECNLGDCTPTITTEDVSSVTNLAFEFKIAQTQTFTTLDSLDVLITPIAADVTLKCLYPATLDVTSAEMTVKGAAASGTTTKTGDLTDGFELSLFTDDGFSTAVTADNVIIGYPIYAKMSWSVMAASSSIQYHVEECSVTKSDTTDAIKIVRNNCYSTALGAQQLTATKMVDNDFTFKFISFIIKDSGAAATLEMDATVTCQVQMCLKSDTTNCAESAMTSSDTDCLGGDSTLANFVYAANTYVAPGPSP